MFRLIAHFSNIFQIENSFWLFMWWLSRAELENENWHILLKYSFLSSLSCFLFSIQSILLLSPNTNIKLSFLCSVWMKNFNSFMNTESALIFVFLERIWVHCLMLVNVPLSVTASVIDQFNYLPICKC